ncbi:RluA family pseudouridine synthase [Bacilliculturomica massiliensis]|uniref:RluA family pseudouridine synthase n=1 Tax=Bacilliculturomica massiliensis TaxID=1917867 RepID=UPI001030ABB5|nr:RluA family pseudouridine synthase [Bacilliculturomica massiliensis]
MSERTFVYTIKEGDEGLKVKELLRRRLGFSSRLMRKLKVQGGVELNGCFVRLYEKGRPGDLLTVTMPEERSQFEPENIRINVLYEDDDLLFINKQPGMVVHPTKGHVDHTIANGLMQYMLDTDQSFKIRFINRLDMDTSGVLLIGKNSHCQDDFAKQAAENRVEKKYTAVVRGVMEEEEGTVDLPIALEQEDHVRRAVRQDGYPSVTHYRVLERYLGYTLVELLLETGRTHQIRVHMAHIGHPVVGDILYGKQEDLLIDRQALHAKSLSLLHPVTRSPLTVEAPLPEDMICLIEKLRARRSGK